MSGANTYTTETIPGGVYEFDSELNLTKKPTETEGFVAGRAISSLSVRELRMARASVALMVQAQGDFEVRLYSANGNLVAKRRGSGNSLVQFGENGGLPQGNYIAVIKSGSLQKTLKVKTY